MGAGYYPLETVMAIYEVVPKRPDEMFNRPQAAYFKASAYIPRITGKSFIDHDEHRFPAESLSFLSAMALPCAVLPASWQPLDGRQRQLDNALPLRQTSLCFDAQC